MKFILPRTHGGVSHPKIKVSAGTFSSPYTRGGVSRPEKPGGVSEFGVVALAEVVFEYAPQTVEQTDMGKFGNDKVVN